jgi:uncharacterized protein
MTGSILAFPNASFLWRIEYPSEITVESLAPVMLHRPKIEYIFIGTAKPMDRNQLEHLKKEMKEKGNIVVEWLPLVSIAWLSISAFTFAIMSHVDFCAMVVV